MPASPTSVAEFWELLRKSGIWPEEQWESLQLRDLPGNPQAAADLLVQKGLLTSFQARQLLAGRYKGFRIGQYVVQDIIGRGGMGAVYLAKHMELHRKVALKVLLPAQGEDQRLAQERFFREARAAAALDHPNIVRIFDVARHNNLPYLIMEYVDGETLQQVLDREGALPYTVAVEYIAQAAAGLQHAHERGFVHRDIKPGNLMRDKAGVVKILDMGLARTYNSTDNVTERLDKGAVVGTADFISPEQALSQPNIDGRADIYSLGATLFALIIGKPPFEGNTTQKLLQHQLRSAPRLSSLDNRIPKELCDVVAKMLAKRPEDRYQSAAEVIAALAPWTAGSTRVLAGISHTRIGQEPEVAVNLAVGSLGGSSVRLGELSHSHMTSVETPRTGYSALQLTPPLSGRRSSASHTRVTPSTDASGLDSTRPTDDTGSAGTGQRLKTWYRRRVLLGVVGSLAVVTVGALAAWQLGGSPTPQPVAHTPNPIAPITPPPGTDPSKEKTLPPNRENPLPKTPSAKGRVIYEWKAADVPVFRVRMRGGQVLEGQRPALRTGIAIYTLKPDTEAEFTRDTLDGKDCFTIIRHTQALGAQIAFELERDIGQGGLGLQMAPSGKYALQIDYRTAAQIQASVHTIQGYRSAGFRVFPSTGTQWVTAELPFTRQAEPLRCAIEAAGSVGVPVAIAAVRIVELEPPPLPREERPLFVMDLRNQQPFRIVCGLREDPNNNQRHYREISRQGEPPAGWHVRPWRVETEVEFTLVEDQGRPALSFRNLKGRGSAMLFMPEFECPTGVCRLELEYRCTTQAQQFNIRFKPNDARPAWDIFRPATTQGAWRRESIVADLRGATGGFFEFHNNDDNTQAYVQIRDLKVTELPPATLNESILYQLRAADLPEFKNIKQGRSITSGNPDPVIAGVYFGGWKPETISEWTCGTVAGSKAIGIVNVNEVLSAQIGIELEKAVGVKLTPGQKVRLRVEYRTAGSAEGRIYFQTYDDWKVPFSTDLPNSNGRWCTVDLLATRGDQPLRCLIDTNTTGHGNILFIRTVTITDAGRAVVIPKSSNSPPTTQPMASDEDPSRWAEGARLYRLDVSSISPFRVVKEKSKQISGEPEQLPPGVGCQCWKEGSVGEFRRAMVDNVPALGLTGLNDTISAQFYFNLETVMKLPLEPGKYYKVKVTYMTHNDARGNVVVHRVPGYQWIASVRLENTQNRWQTASLIFRRPPASEDVQVRMVIDNTTVGEGNTLWIRDVEIMEVIPSKKS
jgi:serine/threonine protein kinase